MGSGVAAVIITRNRKDLIRTVLDRLRELPVDEVVVVDNGSTDGTAAALGERDDVVAIEPGANLGIAGRNLGARKTGADFLLFLDDDSYPLPGAIEALTAAMRADPRLAVAAGLVRDVDGTGNVVLVDQPGTFDWYFRSGGRRRNVPDRGLPIFFFPEGAALVRRDAFMEVGGFLEPLFMGSPGHELTTRLLAAGWDVRYFPQAAFDHVRPAGHSGSSRRLLRYRVRNQLWYFWLHFPPSLAVRRMAGYLAYDLVQSVYRGVPGAWTGGIADAWRQRDRVRSYRRPLPRGVLRRAELDRGRIHLRLLGAQLRRRVSSSDRGARRVLGG